MKLGTTTVGLLNYKKNAHKKFIKVKKNCKKLEAKFTKSNTHSIGRENLLFTFFTSLLQLLQLWSSKNAHTIYLSPFPSFSSIEDNQLAVQKPFLGN